MALGLPASVTTRLHGHSSKGVGSGPRPSSALLAVAVLVTAIGLIPIIFVVLATIVTGPATVADMVIRPRVAELLLNTAALVGIAVPMCCALGVAAAWLVVRTDLPGRRLLAVLFATPLAIPAFVASYGWASVLPSLSGLGGAVLISVLAYFPLVYLPVAATLQRVDPALEESAQALGRSPGRAFMGVVVPQLRLPILGGALLVSLHLLAEYGAFAMLRFDTFTTAIISQYRSTFAGPAATMLAGVLVLCCLGLLVLEGLARGGARYARIGPGASRPARRVTLGRATVPVLFVAIGVIGLAVGVPIASVIRWLGLGGIAVWQERWVVPAVVQTVGYGLGGAAITTLLALPVAYLVVRFPSRLSRVLETSDYLTSSLPGIVIALALVTVAITFLRPAYQTTWLVLLAYVLMFLPRSLVSLRGGIAQVPVSLEEAARSMGVPPVRTFLRVTGRLIIPAALAGGALVFLGVVNELTTTLLLAPTGTRTMSIEFWTHVKDLDYAQAAPYALMMIAVSLPVTWLLFRASRLSSVS